MSTIHCRLDVLAPRAFCSSGRATFSDEFPATISTRLRQRTPRLHHRLSYTSSAVCATATGKYYVWQAPTVPQDAFRVVGSGSALPIVRKSAVGVVQGPSVWEPSNCYDKVL